MLIYQMSDQLPDLGLIFRKGYFYKNFSIDHQNRPLHLMFHFHDIPEYKDSQNGVAN
ncbi:hypothetical protein SAMN05720354_104120 [Nitrosospira sp. Nsp1]|nr:hypothetical protein SAMN05720354_104120 [Nitrosospira sp. Nsp1]